MDHFASHVHVHENTKTANNNYAKHVSKLHVRVAIM